QDRFMADSRTVHEGAVVALQPEMVCAHRRNGARRADHLYLAALDRAADAVLGAERCEIAANALDHLAIAGAFHGSLARMALHARLGQGNDAPRYRRHVDQLGGDAAEALVAADGDPAHLGRAAADIDQQAKRNLRIEEVLATRERKP